MSCDLLRPPIGTPRPKKSMSQYESSAHVDLRPEHCRKRQRRLIEAVSTFADIVVVTRPEHVQYVTGHRPGELHTALAAVHVDGECTLVVPRGTVRPETEAAASTVVEYDAQHLCTLRQDQVAAAASALATALQTTVGTTRVGLEQSGSLRLADAVGARAATDIVDIDPILWRLRRQKDQDELAMLQRAITCTEEMYVRARELIAPGVTELEVYSALHAAAVNVAGEPLTALGNDYRCAAPGGPPRLRAAQAGELYILDLGPGYRGYHADNCRTFSVDQNPTDEQTAAWHAVASVFDIVESTVRPGASCRALFETAKSTLDEHLPGGFVHHLGHGVGLYPHEAPHLNPHWDDVFERGDVFTVEPGLYSPELRAGIRIEENYLVEEGGVRRLTNSPREL